MLCTEPNSPYTCHADDGSPLVSIYGGAGLGIASNFGKCPQPELPSVFININANGIKQFIDAMLNKYKHYATRSSRGRGKNRTDNAKSNRKQSHVTTPVPSSTHTTECDSDYEYEDIVHLKKKLP